MSEQLHFEFSEYPEMPTVGLANMILSKQTSVINDNSFDPHKMMMKRKLMDSGETVDVTPKQSWPENDIKALEEFCLKYGIIGFNCGRMSPVAALSMLKQKIGVIEPNESKTTYSQAMKPKDPINGLIFIYLNAGFSSIYINKGTNNMNKFLHGFITAVTLTILVGCSTLLDNNQGVFGKAQANNNKADTQIRVVENQQAQANEDKLAHIGAWAQGGVEQALNKLTNNIPPEVSVAKQMNARVEALAGKPDFKEVEAIKGIVDDLLSQSQKLKDDGEKALAAKDKEIATIQLQDKQLDAQRETEIANALKQSDANAQIADQYKATLSDMDKWGGLGAVWYGLHKFVIRAAWVLSIGGVLFLILRLLASSNPIAAAIFGVFDQIGSWFIHTIALIFPKALSIAGNVSTTVYNTAKSALSSIVDSVETVKLQQQSSGTPATIQDLLNSAETTMTPADKATIEQIKLQLGWVKPAVVPTTVVTTPTTPVTASLSPVVMTLTTSSSLTPTTSSIK